MRKIIGCCLIAVSLLACTACSGLDRLSENLREGAEQLGDDVVIGKSNALIAPYQSFEGSRTSDNDAFLATYDASVTGFNGQDILVADTDLKENECREIVIRYQFDSPLRGTVNSFTSPRTWRSKCFLNLPAEALPFSFKLERTTSESPAQTIRARSRLLWDKR